MQQGRYLLNKPFIKKFRCADCATEFLFVSKFAALQQSVPQITANGRSRSPYGGEEGRFADTYASRISYPLHSRTDK